LLDLIERWRNVFKSHGVGDVVMETEIEAESPVIGRIESRICIISNTKYDPAASFCLKIIDCT
jgi:hypothetical protein